MISKTTKQSGFTIVELLIVIVVIGILAAITVVAYNGVQNNATNTKTAQAMTAWVKALTLYKVDNGHWPNGWVCLGSGYGYGLNDDPTTGTGQCRQSAGTGYNQNAAFDTSIRPYLGATLPTPAFVTSRSDDINWRRGLMYAYGGGDGTIVYIEASYAGQLGACPTITGVTATTRAFWGANTYCNYYIGKITDT